MHNLLHLHPSGLVTQIITVIIMRKAMPSLHKLPLPLWLLLLTLPCIGQAAKVDLPASEWGLEQGDNCVSCHQKASNSLHQQWQQSTHAAAGVNCFDCHQADKDDTDAHEHEGEVIATIVSPKDCGRCHTKEAEEAKNSIHSQALALMVERTGATEEALESAGCTSCHGGRVEAAIDGTVSSGNWPNAGIGRINPDGSRGSCSACHGRHLFSKAQARDPAACSSCHSGSESPDSEIYQQSRHGVLLQSQREAMNFGSDSWITGKDYSATATCVTCHMGEAPGLNPTHDVGMRDAWSLNGPVSEKQSLVIFANGSRRDLPLSHPSPRKGEALAMIGGEEATIQAIASPNLRRKAMRKVCLECHSSSFADRFFHQFDQQIEAYNQRFGIPGKAIMDDLYRQNRLTPTPFDEPLEKIWWQIWHDLGVSMRHGAAMSSLSHTFSDGLHAIEKRFYGAFLPEVRAVAGDEGESLIERHLQSGSSPTLPTYGMVPAATSTIDSNNE
ncbi:MAG: hypothetical protein HQL48_07205 [Gammaproteobacteria bacterium]|nr:hypothetical protein [Gammaproteobacteria bacterium]